MKIANYKSITSIVKILNYKIILEKLYNDCWLLYSKLTYLSRLGMLDKVMVSHSKNGATVLILMRSSGE